MKSINIKKIIINTTIVLLIFFLDRITKNYIINLSEIQNTVDIYLTPYLNLYLVWNKGIAFGLFSSEQNLFYNFVTILIIFLIIIIFLMILKSNNMNIYFLLFILGGASGNLFDRIYYSAVPDFIDFHFNNIHWFIFNVADIFISFGIICLIFVEIFFNKKVNDEPE
jgi:signal peptidase II|tara:strand:- start:1418 stop:1918 length:501 start_codon:yes stop_codon:yes gene_type:complete